MNDAETRFEHNRQGILDGSTVGQELGPAPSGGLSKPSDVKESLTTAHQQKRVGDSLSPTETLDYRWKALG
jgi:hypothetical protein